MASSSSFPSPSSLSVSLSPSVQKFYESERNRRDRTMMTASTKILTKLVENALTQQDEKYRCIRLGNPKIQQAVLEHEGGLAILLNAGFNKVEIDGESVLLYNVDEPNAAEDILQQLSSLTVVVAEKKNPNVQGTTTSTPPKSTPDNENKSPFLSDEERAKRQREAVMKRKAKEAEKAKALARFREDQAERDLIAKRQTALKQAAISPGGPAQAAAGGGIVAGDTTTGTNSIVNEYATRPDIRIIKKCKTTPACASTAAAANATAAPSSHVSSTKQEQETSPATDPVRSSTPTGVGTTTSAPSSSTAAASGLEEYREQQRLRRLKYLQQNGKPQQQEHTSDDGPASVTSSLKNKYANVFMAGSKITLDDIHDKTSTITASMPDDPNANASAHINQDEDEDRKPAAVDMQYAVKDETPSPDSTSISKAEWKRYLGCIPPCCAATGIRETSVYRNKYDASASGSAPKCLRKLLRELDGMCDVGGGGGSSTSSSLGCCDDPRSSIFVRFDDETPQYIRAMIAAALPGPTPYAGGLFVFDIYCPPDYPHVPPKVSLLTTGGGTVRFGPNLYAEGKVCLSLLGTWPGPKWIPEVSNLTQVLISIQGMILGESHPYYLEPGHGGWEGQINPDEFQSHGQTLSGKSVVQDIKLPIHVAVYEDTLRVGTIKYAMLEMIRTCVSSKASAAADGNKKEQIITAFAPDSDMIVDVDGGGQPQEQQNTAATTVGGSVMSSNTGAGTVASSTMRYLTPFLIPIAIHFYHNRDAIRDELRSWLETCEFNVSRSSYTDASSSSLLSSTLPFGGSGNLHHRMKQLYDQLRALVPVLESELFALTKPEILSQAVVQSQQSKTLDEIKDVEMAENADRKNLMGAGLSSLKRPPQENANSSSNDCVSSSRTSKEKDTIAMLRDMMQKAAAAGDYVKAGKMQSDLESIEELKKSMQAAASSSNFIRAGKLQEQLNARLDAIQDLPKEFEKQSQTLKDLMMAGKGNKMNIPGQNHPALFGEEDQEEDLMDSMASDEDDNDNDMFDDDDNNGIGPVGGAGSLFPTHGNNLPKNWFPPAGTQTRFADPRHRWIGEGRTLASQTNPQDEFHQQHQSSYSAGGIGNHTATADDTATSDDRKQPAKLRSGEVCRLRIRLPDSNILTLDFDALDTIADVYRCIDPNIQSQSHGSLKKAPAGLAVAAVAKQKTVMTEYGPQVVRAPAFSQHLSIKGYTLLLSYPKREFHLEMHGTKSLREMGLAPSASLTVMMCTDRGVVRRGDLESRLNQAQGDAMDVDGLTYESLLELTERVGACETGWTTEDDKKLDENSTLLSPKEYYDAVRATAGTPAVAAASTADAKCPICLGEFDVSDPELSLRTLQLCRHGDNTFHEACLRTWLQTRKSCPICKSSVFSSE